VSRFPGEAQPWHDLAISLEACGRQKLALSALEKCLRTDPGYVEGWFQLGEWAIRARNHSYAGEVAGELERLLPRNDRVAAFRRRIVSSLASAA
jgi:cytochrome c-type biogenesis protein CcmH/NrfG